MAGSSLCLVGAVLSRFCKNQAYDILDITAAHRCACPSCHPVAIPEEKNFNVCMTLQSAIRAAVAR
jgi:hypothetical protein